MTDEHKREFYVCTKCGWSGYDPVEPSGAPIDPARFCPRCPYMVVPA